LLPHVYLLGEPASLLVVANTHPLLSLVCQQLPYPLLVLGFMAGRGIQEPSLLVTHLIQDTQLNQTLLQLVSFDKEKAFNRIGHAVIILALRAFRIPERIILALINLTLIG
jgi:hypothetical protein